MAVADSTTLSQKLRKYCSSPWGGERRRTDANKSILMAWSFGETRCCLETSHGKITRQYSWYCTVAFCYVYKCDLSYRCPGHDIKLHPHRMKLYRIGCVWLSIGDWLIDCFTAHQHWKYQETLLIKIWSRFIEKYNCVWRNTDWPASWHISTKSYQWQWKCKCSLTSCPGHHSIWMQFNVMPRTDVVYEETQTGWPHDTSVQKATSDYENVDAVLHHALDITRCGCSLTSCLSIGEGANVIINNKQVSHSIR